MSSLTAKKQHVSTQSETELKIFIKRSTERFNNSKEFLFDTSTESSKMIMMNSFEQEQDESSRSEQS